MNLWKHSLQQIELQVPFLRALAQQRDRDVTLFDLESTTLVELAGFGITELGLIHVLRNGRIFAMSHLVNPEYAIPEFIQQKTGITDDMVRDKPTWAAWANLMNSFAEKHILIGYNSERFDVPAVDSQNRRYGFAPMDVRNHGDVYAAICDIQGFWKGKLEEVAERYGRLQEVTEAFGRTPSGSSHRAKFDALVLAVTADSFIAEHGTSRLFKTDPVIAPRNGEKRPTKVELVSEAITRNGVYDPVRIAKETNMVLAEVESAADALYRGHAFPSEVFAREDVQSWLDAYLPDAMRVCWTSTESEGRLKPVMEHLQATGAGAELTYLQLRVAITRHKRTAAAA